MWKSRISFRTFKCQKYIKYKFCHFVFLHNLKVCVLLMFIVWRDLKLKCRLLEWMITDQSELFSLFVAYFVQEQALQQFIHYPVTKSGFTYRTKTFSNPPNPVIVPFGILSVIKKTYLTALTKWVACSAKLGCVRPCNETLLILRDVSLLSLLAPTGPLARFL